MQHAPTVYCLVCEPCASVQASISAGSGSWNGKRSKLKGVRKITPSQPTGVSFKAKAQVPPAVAAVADGTSYGSHPTKLKLQQAFLEQYSAAEDKVPAHAVCSLSSV